MTQQNLWGETTTETTEKPIIKKPSVSQRPYVSDCEKEKMKDSFLTPEERGEKLRKDIAAWKNGILTESMVWDMRCWDKLKDRDEVMRMIDTILSSEHYEALNAGHAMFCVRELVKNGVSKEEVCNLFLLNDKRVYYAQRIVKCWSGIRGPCPCPYYNEKDGFSKCPCDKCDGKV